MKKPSEPGKRRKEHGCPPHDTTPTESLASTFSGKLAARLEWKDGELVAIKVFAKSPSLGEEGVIDTMSVFRVESDREKLTLTRDPSAVVAREKRSAAGAPTYIELHPGGPTASALPAAIAKTTVRLKWEDHALVDVRVGGAFAQEADPPASMRRRVFKTETSEDQVVLAADSTACPAWVEYAANGAPTRIELQHTGNRQGGASPRHNTVISLDWDDGALSSVRVRGDLPTETIPAGHERRMFRVWRRDNEVSLAAEALGVHDDHARQAVDLDHALRAIDKTLHSLDKKVDVLDATVRQDIADIAGGVVEAMWRAQRVPRRLDAALPLVLIAQIHRSGGTLLARLFDGHPQIFAFPQELTWRDGARETKYSWPDIDPSSEGPLRLAKRLVERIADDARTYNLLGYTKQATGRGKDQRLPFQWSQWAYVETFLDTWQAKPPRNRRECLDIFMTAYFSAFLDWRDSQEPKKIVTALKTRTNFVRSYPQNEAFFDDYPDGLMISICRHPADWCASATHAGEKYAGPDEAMAMWRESAECALDLKERHPGQVVLVSFENLVMDPAKTMRWLADRVGVTWNAILTVPTFNGMLVASNSSFEAAVGIDASVLRRRDTLPKQVRERIETDNLPLYRRFVAGTDT
jgi:sulfotransferase family protein